MAPKLPYYSVCTIKVKPENQAKVVEFFTRVAAETKAKEPAAQQYRWYKVEGKDEFVWMEMFDSEEDYRSHQKSEHVGRLYKEYAEWMPEGFVFYPIDTKERACGGHERFAE